MPLRRHIPRVLLALCAIAFGPGPALAAWELRTIDAGGIPGQEAAISSATSLAYVPLLAQRALAVFDGVNAPSRMALSIRPTSVGYSAGTGRIFVAGMFDNAVVAIDEATGAQTRIDVGPYPTGVLVDDSRGKVYVQRWGGIRGEGGLAIIDGRSLAVRDVYLGGAITGMAQDRETGALFLTGESFGSSGPGMGFILALDAEGHVIGRQEVGYQAYSLAVDSRDGRVYLGELSGKPIGGAAVSRIFKIYSQPGLKLLRRIEWPAGSDYSRLNFLVDPARPGLYFGSGGSSQLLRVDPEGDNLQAWHLPAGRTVLQDGRTIVNGIFALRADPATGAILALRPAGSMITQFDPRGGAIETIGIPGAVGFSGASFWPDASRMLVTDAIGAFQMTVLRRSPASE
jgi:hypothetical protein